MTYGHLQADCLYTRISSGPNARYRVWEAFTFFYLTVVWLGYLVYFVLVCTVTDFSAAEIDSDVKLRVLV